LVRAFPAVEMALRHHLPQPRSGQKRRQKPRGLAEVGPAGFVMWLLMSVTAFLAIAILAWLFYVIIKSLFGAF
jgi:hypothetical protein